jgi:hypothetical protein
MRRVEPHVGKEALFLPANPRHRLVRRPLREVHGPRHRFHMPRPKFVPPLALAAVHVPTHATRATTSGRVPVLGIDVRRVVPRIRCAARTADRRVADGRLDLVEMDVVAMLIWSGWTGAPMAPARGPVRARALRDAAEMPLAKMRRCKSCTLQGPRRRGRSRQTPEPVLQQAAEAVAPGENARRDSQA